MWDTAQGSHTYLSHDMPCVRCGHAPHTFLACGDGCDCQASDIPQSLRLRVG